jgi:aspartate aminotransferase-like enzyme
MPTDSLTQFRDTMLESGQVGFDALRAKQQELGKKVRKLLADKGIKSVAAPGFEAPGVVVCYTDQGAIQNGKAFSEVGLQIAAGVPLQCDEGDDYQSFRLGLFGLEKLKHVDRTVATLSEALDAVL